MARINGPVWKVSRRLQFSILETGEEFAGKRPRTTAPGKAPDARPAKLTNYGQQLREKQRIRFTYGVNERQFYNLYLKAQHAPGNTGHNFLFLLESRLDNVVYRMGISPSRRGARQLVSHRHITVNGELVNIPSYSLKAGDVVGVREKSKSLQIIQDSLAATSSVYEWITWNSEKKEGTFVSVPERIQIPENIKEQLIVELYSK